ncbi:MAG: GAF domain-containing protein [Cyanobacteria bacterium P01_A01_bin.114]
MMKTPERDRGLGKVADRLARTLKRDALVKETLDSLRSDFRCDRVALYYFYRRWKGQVTAESLSLLRYSIYGSTGADDCFNDEYAQLYLEGRVRAIDNIETAELATCHRDFLRAIQVQANLVAPVLTEQGLWGLLAAHHCQAPRQWSAQDIDTIRAAAQRLANAPSIRISAP